MDTPLPRNGALEDDPASALWSALPMAHHALAALGADAAQLQAFAARHPMPPTASHDAPEAAPALGRAEAWPAWLAHDRAMIAREGRDATLRRVLPQRLEGLAAAGLHGVIRLACGVRFGSDDEIAAGLAMLAAFRIEVALPSPTAGTGAAEGLRALAQGTAPADAALAPPLAAARLSAVLADPRFRAAVPPLRIEKGPERGWASLLLAAVRLYRASDDPAAQHLIRAAHALQILWPWLAEPEAVLQRFWVSLCAVFVTIGRPWPMEYMPLGDAPTGWDALRTAACKADDPHVITLVDTCFTLARRLDPETSDLPFLLRDCARQALQNRAA